MREGSIIVDTSQSISSSVAEARRLAEAGHKDKALSLLREILRKAPDHIPALLWLAGLTPDVHEGIATLQRVLVLDPANVPAQRGLDSLQAKAAVKSESTPSTVEQEATPSPPVAEEKPAPSGDPIAAARAVIWPFRGLHRPIGELLDEGVINKGDLMYAARRAYDEKVRQAAATLLGDEAPPEMSVEQARAVVWSFRGEKGPLGELLDAGRIDGRDLHWAARKAYDPRVRQAASVLLSAWRLRSQKPAGAVSQRRQPKAGSPPKRASSSPKPSPAPARSRQGTLRVISGSDYLRHQEEAKQRRAVYLVIPIIALWLTSLALSVGLIAVGLAQVVGLMELSLPIWVNGLGLAMILVDYALLPTLERLVEERDQYYQGRKGEEATVKALQRYLDGQWTLFRNVVLPGSQADIDAVLVGPPGVYALEIKSYNGRFQNRGEKWFRRRGPAWRRLTKNPSRQAKANAARLAEYLSKTVGTKVWVEPRVVWAGPGKLIPDKPAVYIWFLDNMATYVAELAASPAKSEALIQQVREALMMLQLDKQR